MNVRELAAGADDGVAVVPQLPGHEDQGGGAAADGKQGRPPPPVQAVAGGQPDQQGGLPVQAGDGSAAAGDQTTVSNSQQAGGSGMTGLGRRQEAEGDVHAPAANPATATPTPAVGSGVRVVAGVGADQVDLTRVVRP